MKTKEIIALEKGNTNQIILLKEGLFWHTYNVSAFLFSNHIQEFKITKKYVKNVTTEILNIGFPASILEKIQEKATTRLTVKSIVKFCLIRLVTNYKLILNP